MEILINYQRGFLIVAVLIYLAIFSGIVLALTKFRKNLSGPKIMIIGIELIALSVVFIKVFVDFARFNSINFIILLIGVILSFIGLFYKNDVY